MSKIWSWIRKMRGKYSSISYPILKDQDGDRLVSDEAEVAEMFANHYEKVSSSESYSPQFQASRLRSERMHIDFSVNNYMSYNEDFSMCELERALSSCRDTSPGLDSISYRMIKYSHPTCKSFLLILFNKIWNTCYFPEKWRTGIVLSFLKPGKDPSDVKSYRPISLTSCVSKLLEKMVNTRLVLVLESKGLLPQQQNGFRKMRSTQNSLEKVTSNILSALNQKSIALCVSFDIEKAYEKTWRYHI